MKFFRLIKMYFKMWHLRIILKFNLLSEDNYIHYIGGNEALPPPLTTEEEGFLIKRLSTENEVVKNIFIERNLRLVVYIARKFENTGVNVEDLISVGTMGL